MLLVDERIGSKDLLLPLQRYGVPAELSHLDFGDFAFVGKGLNGTDLLIGVELKESRDLVSSLQSARFPGHQLPGLQSTYDRAWLLTEGIWRAGAGGVLEVMAGGWRTVRVGTKAIMMDDLESWILTQAIRGGLQHWHCSTRADTIRFLSVLYHWWTDKELQEHRSHQAIYLPPPDRAMMSPPSTMLKVLACIDGVGWEKGRALEEHFGSLGALTSASVKDLTAVPGIGKVLAANIQKAFAA